MKVSDLITLLMSADPDAEVVAYVEPESGDYYITRLDDENAEWHKKRNEVALFCPDRIRG